jgi:hypothetical protein
MKKSIYLHSVLFFLTLLFAACQPSERSSSDNADKPKTAVAEKPVAKKWTTEDAVKAAEAKFEKYLPKILKSHDDAAIDVQESNVGDFTGDGIDDVAIYFSLTPGGNAISSVGLALYKNTGTDVEVVGGYEPDNYLFDFIGIRDGKIYIEKTEYAPEDGHCCPSIKTPQVLTVNGNTITCTDVNKSQQ